MPSFRNGITYHPYGVQEIDYLFFYKHSVPTKSTPNARMAFGGTKEHFSYLKITKLTLMVQLGNRTYKGCSHILDWTIHINVCDKGRPKIEN